MVGPAASRPGPARRPSRRVGAASALLAGSVALGLVVAAMALPFVGTGAIAARDAARSFEDLPSTLYAPPPPERSVLLAADGSVLAQIAYENRVQVPLTAISPAMRGAIVAIEDARFYQHGGIDPRGTLRALVRNSSAGTVEQGGSTLTQQYVKNVLIETAQNDDQLDAARARTLSRKLQEARYAIALDAKLSKDQILDDYLNIAYFGDGAYGVEAAATHYFGVHASQLTLAEAATLAGIVQSPISYDPALNPTLSQVRRDVVLTRMQQEGVATPAAVAAAIATPLRSYVHVHNFQQGCISSYAPYFCDYVLSVMRSDPAFGATAQEREALLKRGGLTIRTTLVPRLQRAAQHTVDAFIPQDDASGKAADVVTVQPGTGRIQVMAQDRTYGSAGPGQTTVNYAVDAAHDGWREGVQAGSTFKAFTIAAALQAGVPVDTSISTGATQTFTGFHDCQGHGFAPYTVSSDASGTQTMDSAAALSVNGYFVALEKKAGLCNTAAMVDRLGVRQADGTAVPRVPSLTLGTATTTPLAMAGAYATFAADGVHCTPVAITSVTTRNGTSLKVPSAGCGQVISTSVAESVTQVLTNVIDGPYPARTGAAMSLGRPAAGKTGTTENNAAVWFVGYTPQLATAVWVGDPRGATEYPLRDVTINGHFYAQLFGATFAGPIWKQVMLAALQGVPVERFTAPDPNGVLGVPTTVPDLRDADSADALVQLQDVGLVGVIAQNAVQSALPAGTVLFTSPRAGTRLQSGDTVTLYVSSGYLGPTAPAAPTAPSAPSAPPPSRTAPPATRGSPTPTARH